MGAFKLVPNYFRCSWKDVSHGFTVHCWPKFLLGFALILLLPCHLLSESHIETEAYVNSEDTNAYVKRAVLISSQVPVLRMSESVGSLQQQKRLPFWSTFVIRFLYIPLATPQLFWISFACFFQPSDDERVDWFSGTRSLTSLTAIVSWVISVHIVTIANTSQHYISSAIIPP